MSSFGTGYKDSEAMRNLTQTISMAITLTKQFEADLGDEMYWSLDEAQHNLDEAGHNLDEARHNLDALSESATQRIEGDTEMCSLIATMHNECRLMNRAVNFVKTYITQGQSTISVPVAPQEYELHVDLMELAQVALEEFSLALRDCTKFLFDWSGFFTQLMLDLDCGFFTVKQNEIEKVSHLKLRLSSIAYDLVMTVALRTQDQVIESLQYAEDRGEVGPRPVDPCPPPPYAPHASTHSATSLPAEPRRRRSGEGGAPLDESLLAGSPSSPAPPPCARWHTSAHFAESPSRPNVHRRRRGHRGS
ncbi:hypothetical protein DFH06DRAFT_1200514, partial [Mycena polygramma]